MYSSIILNVNYEGVDFLMWHRIVNFYVFFLIGANTPSHAAKTGMSCGNLLRQFISSDTVIVFFMLKPKKNEQPCTTWHSTRPGLTACCFQSGRVAPAG